MSFDAAPFHRRRGSLPTTAPTRREVPEGFGEVGEGPLLIDCDTCCARGIGCGDCVVTVLLGGPPSGVTLNDEERRAVEVLAAAGMIPPLRLVHGVETAFIDPE